MLSVPVSFFFDGDMNPAPASDSAGTGLSFLETAGAVRLVRAYATVEDPQIRRALVDLAEEIAGSRGREPGRRGAEPRRRARRDGRRTRLS